jgi:hypothetical protein
MTRQTLPWCDVPVETLALRVVASCAVGVPDCEDTSSSSAPLVAALVIGAVVLALVIVGILTIVRSTRRR